MGIIDTIKDSGITEIVGKAAPLLATVLGSPLAGAGIALLANAFGTDAKDVKGLVANIAGDPEAMLKLKTLEYEHADTLARLASQDYLTEVDDRKDARRNSSEYKDFLRHFAYLVTLGFFAALFALFLPVVNISLDADEKQLLAMLVGVLVSKWQTIIDFFYGSSRK